MRRYNEVTQCIAFSRCQYLELCVPSNDAVVRKWNVKDDSEPLNVACCIMEKWQLFRDMLVELSYRIATKNTESDLEDILSPALISFYLFLLQFYVLIKRVNGNSLNLLAPMFSRDVTQPIGLRIRHLQHNFQPTSQ